MQRRTPDARQRVETREVNPTGRFEEPQSFPGASRHLPLPPPATSPASAAEEERFITHCGWGADREKAMWEENLDPDSSGDFLSKYFYICKETSFCLRAAVMVVWAKLWRR